MAMAIILDELTYQEYQRHILFSDDCMSNEIHDHFWGYMAARKDVKWSKAPLLFRVKCDAELLFKRHDAMSDHCHVIDIYEGDVYDWKQASVFSYFDGIRECYFHTQADPYVNDLGLRIKYNKYFSVPSERTKWQSYLQTYGKKR